MFKRQTGNKKGETLIIVIIVAALLLIIGAAVLTFASSNLNSTSKNVQSKDVYYISKSTASIITESIEGGSLGKLIRDKVASNFTTNVNKTVGSEWDKKWEFSPTIVFNEERLQGYKVTGMKITFDSTGSVTSVYGSTVTGASINMNDIFVKYQVKDELGNNYTLKITYNYTGWYANNNGKEKWSNEIWKAENVEN